MLLTLSIRVTNADLLPPSTKYSINNEVQACFNLENYKKLLQLAVDLGAELQKTDLLSRKVVEQETIITSQKKIIINKDNVIILYKKDQERLFNLWSEENRKRHLAENRPAYGSWVSWGLAGGFAVSTVVLGAIVLLD